MNVHGRAAALLTLVLLAVPAGMAGQQGLRRGMGMGRAEMERRIQARFGELVRIQLGLDADQQRRLGAALQEFQERREVLARRELALRQRIQGIPLARQERVPLPSEAEADAILREMLELRRAEVRLLEEEQGRLLGILSPPQLARFYGMREQLAERIRRLREGPGRGPMGPGGGPGGGGAGFPGPPGGR